MKKILLFASALAGLFLAGSCQRENLEPQADKQVTFTIEAPAAMQTKAIADGLNVDELIYEVWITGQSQNVTDLSGATRLYQAKTDKKTVADGKVSFKITLDLVNDQNFTVLFWAQNSANGVYKTEKLTEVTYLENANVLANYANRDAFYGSAFVSDGATATPTVILKRPFAQVNLCTLNLKDTPKEGDYTITLDESKMTFTTVPDKFNIATGDASGEMRLEFAYNAVPGTGDNADTKDKTIKVNDKLYYYAGMNFVFADKNEGNTAKLEYDINTYLNGNEEVSANVNNTIDQIPLKQNYRTNIVGNLLTSKVDYEIIVDAEFNTPAEVVEMWNGSEVNEPKQSVTDANVYEIEFPSELAWLAAAVNGTLPETKAAPAPQDFAGKTFKLMNDIDLCGYEWTPIGNANAKFKGTFDGANHVVKNLVINGGKESDKGLFGVTHDGEIKNLVVENAKVSGRLNIGVVAGQPYTSKYTNITVRGHVEVNGMAYVGGVGGKNAYADWANITVNVDETSYVNANSVEDGTAYRTYVGGVVGFNGEGSHTFKNITSNINVSGTTCDVGGLFGIAHYGNQFENLTCTGNVEITNAEESDEAEEIGGIVGVWMDSEEGPVTFTNVSFNGAVTTNVERETVWYGNLFGKPYNNNGKGKLIFNGNIYVATAEQLQAALNAATGEVTICFGADINGDVTLVQKPDVKITILGESKKYNGTIKVHSNSEHYADAALTVKNVNFETSVTYLNENNEECFSFIEALEHGSERYSTNITVEGCTFTATEKAKNIAVALQIKSSKWAKALNCTANGLHSLVQAQSCDETVEVKGCTITGKNGVAFKQVKAATVEGTTINATAYGIRFDGNTDNYGIVVKDNTISAVQPLIVRKMTGKDNTITLEGTNTLTTEAQYQIVITNDSDDKPYVKPTGTYTLTGAETFSVYPRDYYYPVATWADFTAALAANEAKIRLDADITYDANYQLQKAVTIDLNGMSMTLPMINIHTKTTVKNGTINGKVYARKNSDIVFDNVKFSGAVSDNLSTEGHLAIQSGCKLYAKDCLFSPTSVSGSQTKPLSFEGGSSTMKFENCEFKSSPYKKQVYFNSLSATATLDFTNCNFNTKTPNIMFAATAPLRNLTMSGTTKLSSVTLETNRAKDAVTADDLAYLRTMIANNSISSVRLFYAGGSSEYIR